MDKFCPVILCGGSGTRLWPLSRFAYPKQFIELTSDRSLFQMAISRCRNFAYSQNQDFDPIVVCNELHRHLVVGQMNDTGVSSARVLLEPDGRNTAPAITLAALDCSSNGFDPVLVIVSADQSISDNEAFSRALAHAVGEAETGSVVVLGVPASKAETGYGYIRVFGSTPDSSPFMDVQGFIEKPDLLTAEKYISEGNYYWNAGIFIFRASVWLKLINLFRPEIFFKSYSAWSSRNEDGLFVRPSKDHFLSITGESADYAVFEELFNNVSVNHSLPNVKMVPLLDTAWSDLGSWDAVWEYLPKDSFGNAFVGDVITSEAKNTLVHASSRLVAVVDTDNLVVVETPDAVMVIDRFSNQKVKNIVNMLESLGRDERTIHRKVYRPWGWYDTIDDGPNFRVKRIFVEPGASLSLQSHNHRSEHWIVVRGLADIVCGDEKFQLSENQSTYIPIGARHRLSNPSIRPLELIEVQTGEHLSEDDITRYDDKYGRN